MAAFWSAILVRLRRACFRIHRRGARQETIDVKTLQRRGHEADRAHDRGATADPIVHRETRQPSVFLRIFVQLTAHARDRDGVLAEIQTRLLITRGCFQHPVARLFRAAGFRNHYHQGVREMVADPVEGAIKSVGVRVIEEKNIERIGGVAERVGDELRPEGGPADPDQEKVFETLAVLWRDFSSVDGGGELFNARVGFIDVRAQFRSWSEFGITEPVMADHPSFIRVRDRARLQLAHGGDRLFHAVLHCSEEIIRKTHSADIDGEVEIGIAQEILLKPGPERRGSHSISVTKPPRN
jgi:hypothetical protein